MTGLPKQCHSFLGLLGKSIRHYHSAVWRIFPLVLLMVLVKDAYIFLGGKPTGFIFESIYWGCISLIECYLFACAIYLMNQIWRGERASLFAVMQTVIKRSALIGGCILAYILGVFAIVLFGELVGWLTSVIHSGQHISTAMITVIVAGLPFMIGIMFTYLAYPIVVTDATSIQQAFADSVELTKEYWQHGFGMYTLMVMIVVLLAPNTLHGHMIATHHLTVVFDCITLLILVPIFTNLILLIRNDLALRL